LNLAVYGGIPRQASLQLLAALLAWFFIAPLLHPLHWALLQGGMVALLALALRQPWQACLLQAGFLPLLLFMAQLGLPSWSYLLAFVLTLSLSRNAWLERVPFYRSSHQAVALLAQNLACGVRVLDAGSGDARFALGLAQRRPDIEVMAMENAWGSVGLAYCRWWIAGRPDNLKLECRNFWRENWGQYDVVYVFLSPAPMSRVWDKFVQQGKAGAILISNTFEIPGAAPAQRLPLSGRLQQSLLFWRSHHGTE
jgi:hypothetical protein